MNIEWKCFRYCHLINVIDLKNHFDKIKYPGTIRDLFHTFWILCDDKSRERQETVERESNYFDPQNLRTWRALLEFLCKTALRENTEQKIPFREQKELV